MIPCSFQGNERRSWLTSLILARSSEAIDEQDTPSP